MNDDRDLAIGLICCAATMFTAGMLIGDSIGQTKIKDKAIACRVAKYIVDERTGSTQFVFITNNIPAK